MTRKTVSHCAMYNFISFIDTKNVDVQPMDHDINFVQPTKVKIFPFEIYIHTRRNGLKQFEAAHMTQPFWLD